MATIFSIQGASAAEGAAARTRFVEHRGESVLLLDFSELQDEDALLELIEAGREVVAGCPPASVRTLTDVTGARITTPRVASAFRDAAEGNTPYVLAAAVVGVAPQQRPVYEAVMLFSGRKLHAFVDRAEALDWLAAQRERVE